MTEQRYLGVDHGTRRMGLAVGALPLQVATPLAVVPAQPEAAAIERIVAAAREYDVAAVVVGLPLNMDDTVGPQAKLALEMVKQLRLQLEMPVRTWDERLSSFAADQALAGQYTRKQKKARQDAVAAAEMLSEFLAAVVEGREEP